MKLRRNQKPKRKPPRLESAIGRQDNNVIMERMICGWGGEWK